MTGIPIPATDAAGAALALRRSDRAARVGGVVRRYAPAAVMTVLLVALLAAPLLTLLRTSLFAMNEDYLSSYFTLEFYARIFQAERLGTLTLTSIVFSAGASALALLNGGLVAWLVVRTDAPFKRLAYLTTIVSLGTPYVLYVTSWAYLLGRAGPFNDLYQLLTGAEDPLFNVYGLTGMIVIDGFLWSPLVFLMLSATFRASNADMEEAARIAGATTWTVLTRISLGLAKPAIVALALFLFVRNLESFEVPALIGMPGGVDVLTTEIYRSVIETPPEVGYASAFATLLLVILCVLLAYYNRLARNADRFATVTGKGFRPRPFRLGKARMVGGLIILTNFTLILGLPLIGMIWISLTPYLQPMRWPATGGLSFDNYRILLESGELLSLAGNTLLLATVTASVVMAVTTVAGWLSARQAPGAKAIDPLISMAVVIPGLVLGIALQEFSLNQPFPIYGTLLLIGFGMLIRYLPYGMRYAYNGALQVHVELEHAAGVSGASGPQMLRRIVAPLLAPAIASGWLFLFLLGTKELSLPLMLAGPDSRTISVAMFGLWQEGAAGEAMAMGLSWAVAVTLLAGIPYSVLSRRASQIFGS